METRYILSKPSSKSSEISDDSFEYSDNILAKIKRLHIEENCICQSMRKSENNIVRLRNDFSKDSDYHKFKTYIRDSYMSVKKLFDFVNATISDQAALTTVDVDEIKTAILELEDKIKSLKKYLHLELVNLKHSEEELIHNINENPIKIKDRPKIHSATYNHIVPSPVKEMINSSFKCLEVREFQEFMANSENRYGGWNEYYHNIFVRSWNKHIQVEHNINLESYITNVMNSNSFQLLINELLQRLPGFTKENLILHCKWYIKYIYLKERQSLAIEKWREKKLLIKNKTSERKEIKAPQKITKYESHVAENTKKISSSRSCKTEKFNEVFLNEIVPDDNTILIKSNSYQNRQPLAYMKATKQWISRCQTSSGHTGECQDVPVNIKKLKIPEWRIGLQES